MKPLAIVLALFTFPVEASELYAFYFCGRPAVLIGVIGEETMPATPFDIQQDSKVAQFFDRVVKDLPTEDRGKVVYRIDVDRLIEHKCGVLF